MMWPSAVTRSPMASSPAAAASGPSLLDPPGELVADDDRRLEPVAGPGIPFPDVQVGAADTGVMDADQDVVRSAGRDGDVPQLHADAGGGLHECAHGSRG